MSDVQESNAAEAAEVKKSANFSLDMTVSEAMSVHPRVREVFAAFHLGGCAHCAVGQYETVAQVCQSYGIDPDVLLEALESVVKEEAPE